MTEWANTGHGHVFPRPDGVRMRCGGPPLCPDCAKDLARWGAPEKPEAELQEAPGRRLTFGGVRVLHTIIPMAYADPADPEGQRTLPPEPMCYEHGPDCPVGQAARANVLRARPRP